MDTFLTNLLASLGMAWGVTALTTLSVRSEDNIPLVAGSFVFSTIVVLGILTFIELSPDTAQLIGITGVGLGILLTFGIMLARLIERKSGLN